MNNVDLEVNFSLPEKHIFSSRPKERLSLVSRSKNTARHINNFFKQFWQRVFGANIKKRDQFFVSQIYNRLYDVPTKDWVKTKNESRYEIEFGKENLKVNGWFLKSVYIQMLAGLLDQISCSSVLEVGSGRGDNVVALSLKKQNCKFTGLEYSQEGVSRSQNFLKDFAQSMAMGDVDPWWGQFNLKDNLNFSNINFVQGSALKMPFADNMFDVAFTILVLEQMAYDYQNVLKEMSRVAKKYCVFLEPFREANNLAGLTNLKRRDYFRFSYKGFGRFGLKPVYFFSDHPQKLKYSMGLLVTQVTK